jgi:hypothetical protein
MKSMPASTICARRALTFRASASRNGFIGWYLHGFFIILLDGVATQNENLRLLRS